MYLRVTVGATVFNDDEPAIGVGGVAHRGEDDAAGCVSHQDESVPSLGPEHHVQVGPKEGVDPVLRYDGLGLQRRNRCVNQSSGAGCRGTPSDFRALKVWFMSDISGYPDRKFTTM